MIAFIGDMLPKKISKEESEKDEMFQKLKDALEMGKKNNRDLKKKKNYKMKRKEGSMREEKRERLMKERVERDCVIVPASVNDISIYRPVDGHS